MSGIELDLQAYSIPLLSHFTAFQGVPTQANITHCEILRIDYYSFELQNWRKLQFLGWLGKAGICHIFFKYGTNLLPDCVVKNSLSTSMQVKKWKISKFLKPSVDIYVV